VQQDATASTPGRTMPMEMEGKVCCRKKSRKASRPELIFHSSWEISVGSPLMKKDFEYGLKN